MKKCSSCKEEKLFSEFNKSKNRKDGHHNQCRNCHNSWWYRRSQESIEKKKKYSRDYYRQKLANFSSELFEKRLAEQNYKCAICGIDDPGQTNWHADHDHITGEPRGVLCKKCNTGIGMLNDDIKLISKALDYLNHYTR